MVGPSGGEFHRGGVAARNFGLFEGPIVSAAGNRSCLGFSFHVLRSLGE